MIPYKTEIKYWIIGILSSISIFLLFGIVTDLVPNPWFVRMVEKNVLDYFFLITSSVLLGSYIAVYLYKRTISRKCNIATYGGGAGSFLAFACPVCVKLLVLLFGAATLLTYFNPYRPILGFISIGLLSLVLYFKLKKRRKI